MKLQLPSGFVLGASMTTNYQQLKKFSAKNHKLRNGKFCDWCPHFAEFNEGRKVAMNNGKQKFPKEREDI